MYRNTIVHKTRDGRGYGLYASKHFRKGERIGNYIGERLTMKECKRIYGAGRDTVAVYAIRVGSDTVIDDWQKTGPLAFANDPVDLTEMRRLLKRGYSKYQAYTRATDKESRNAKMVSYGGKATLYATKPIDIGDEILWSYGVGYWLP